MNRTRRTAFAMVLSLVLGSCGGSPPGSTTDGGVDDVEVGGDAAPDTERDTGREPGRDVWVEDTTPDAPDAFDVDDGDGARVEVPPVAVAGPDIAAEAGRSLHFDGSASYDDDGRITAWSWTMGNGVTLSGEEVDYTYPSPGVFTVTLTVTDDDGLTGSDSLLVDLVDPNEAPIARIDGPVEAVMGEETTWDGRASEDDIGISEWEWMTGVDGDPPHLGQQLEYRYEEWEGRPYRLTLRVTDTDGVESLDTLDIHVMAPPVALVEGPHEAYVGDEVGFDATTSYDPDDDSADALEAVRWDFGDGTVTEPSPWFPIHTRPAHTYAEAGRWDVTVSVQDSDGIWRDSATHKIDVFERPNFPPLPQISASSFTVSECTAVTLDGRLSVDDSDAAEDLTYFWDFGDGGTGAGIEVSHTYRRAGAYTVALTAVDLERAAGDTERVVTVTNVTPTAAFTTPSTTVEAGDPVNFDGSDSRDHCEDVGEDRIAGYRWDWGDGVMTAWSASPLATHTWTSGGVYDVTLTVRDDGDPALTATRTVRLTVRQNQPPTAVITGGGTPVGECQAVSLGGGSSTDDRDAASALTYTWDFGDGESGAGIAVGHAYARAGVYRVTLTVRDTSGATDEASRDVTVTNLAPTASFTFGPDSADVGTSVSFDASGSSDRCESPGESRLTGYRWDWGDGTVSGWNATPLAAHAWAAGGVYDVTLTVRDDGDPALTHQRTSRVTVLQNAPPTAVISASPAVADECEAVSLNGSLSTDDRDTTGEMTYAWDFGDGQSGVGLAVEHTYRVAGTYRVTLTVRDTDGATDVAARDIVVSNLAPTASFTFAPDPGEAGELVTFDASASADRCERPGESRITGYRWDWGDGVISTWSASPLRSHTWTTGGLYDVTLTVRDDGDPALTHSKTVRVTIRQNAPPVAVISAATTDADECESVSLSGSLSSDDRDLPSGMTYAWDFGDGTLATGMDVSHSWSREGVYVVRLTVRDGDGATDEASVPVTVSNVAPTASFLIAPNPGTVGSAVSFDASGSHDHCEGPGEDRITGYQWSWGDGVVSSWSASPAASHTYTAAGPYDVVLTVRDDGDPMLTDAVSKRLTINVEDPGPTVENYAFSPNIAYSCTVFDFPIVDFSFGTFELTLDGATATVRTFSGDPGTLTGSRPTADTFTVTGFQPGDGACDETYRMQGTINPDGTITFNLTADYAGPFCGTCTHREWNGRIASPSL